MRADILLWLAGAAFLAGTARAGDDDGHGHGADAPTLSELSPRERRLVLEAWQHVYCACPSENWSRTLSNCPDGCALPQKNQVIDLIRKRSQGAGDESDADVIAAVVASQVAAHGSKAAADPGTGRNGTFLVLGGITLGAILAGAVLVRWNRAAADRRSEAGRRDRPAGASEADAIERELREVD